MGSRFVILLAVMGISSYGAAAPAAVPAALPVAHAPAFREEISALVHRTHTKRAARPTEIRPTTDIRPTEIEKRSAEPYWNPIAFPEEKGYIAKRSAEPYWNPFAFPEEKRYYAWG